MPPRSGDGRELAMFPLGTVLFPSVVLPLHVFEPRYRAMTTHLLGGTVEPELGVVLIERGSEVGGGDERGDIGTLARIAQAAELPDGRWSLVTFGVSRLRVVRWLDDDPWPRALVTDLPDDPGAGPGAGVRWQAVQAGIRRVLALSSELGVTTVPATVELAPDPALGSFQAGAALPLGPLDQRRLLATLGVDDRLALLEELVAEQAEVLEARLRLG